MPQINLQVTLAKTSMQNDNYFTANIVVVGYNFLNMKMLPNRVDNLLQVYFPI